MKPIAVLVMLLALSACSLPVFFRVPVVQGNIVTADQVTKLHKGMTKKQVAYVLGTPLIESPFETDLWDYVFYYRNPRAHVRESNLKLYFVNDKLADIGGDEEYIAQSRDNGRNAGAPGDNQASENNDTIDAPLSRTNSPGLSRSVQQEINSDDQNAAGINARERNRPGPENPVPRRGAPLPGQSE